MNSTKTWIITGVVVFVLFGWWMWKILMISPVDAVVDGVQQKIEEVVPPVVKEQGWIDWITSPSTPEQPKKPDDESPGKIIQRQLDPLK